MRPRSLRVRLALPTLALVAVALPAAAAQVWVYEMDNDQTIHAGDSVVFTGSHEHNGPSTPPGYLVASDRGNDDVITFDTAGVWTFSCGFHSAESVTITVLP